MPRNPERKPSERPSSTPSGDGTRKPSGKASGGGTRKPSGASSRTSSDKRSYKPSGSRTQGSPSTSGRKPSGTSARTQANGRTQKPSGKPANKPSGKPVQQRTPRPETGEVRLYAGKPGEKDGAAPAKRPPRPCKASPARLAALEVGAQARARDAFVHDVLDARLAELKLSPEDRAFATRLALGVAQTRGTLDEIINRALKSPSDVQDDVRDALRVSTYEIMFLDKTAHAAVDQGVELARFVAQRAGGLANAALRKVVAMRPEFPFGDPKTDLTAFARLHAFPEWLAARLVKDIGPEAARDLMVASNEPAPLFVAVNAVRATEQEIVELLTATGAKVEPVSLGGERIEGCLRVSDARVLTDGRVRRALKQGKLLVSDAASQAVASLVLGQRKPVSLLEIGAGRATKTILLQSDALRRFGSQVALTALDNRAFKARLLRERAKEYGVQVEDALVGDATELESVVGERTFSTVFIDAPCSGLGTLRRHPEIRWRLDEETIASFAQTGLALLRSAAAHVEPGGTLVYATCTVTHAENNGVIMDFLKTPEGAPFRLEPINGAACFATRLTPGSSDAHFAVRLVNAGA